MKVAGICPAQVYNSYGTNPRAAGPDSPDYYRHYGCFMGGSGNLLGAQLIYALWVAGESLQEDNQM